MRLLVADSVLKAIALAIIAKVSINMMILIFVNWPEMLDAMSIHSSTIQHRKIIADADESSLNTALWEAMTVLTINSTPVVARRNARGHGANAICPRLQEPPTRKHFRSLALTDVDKFAAALRPNAVVNAVDTKFVRLIVIKVKIIIIQPVSNREDRTVGEYQTYK
ncbi:hypothetical protein AUP68_06441 [Ilyonectria robusta]